MSISKINGVLFKKLVINGAINLKNNSEMIDELNVFPVPDGDTGTNMQMTMMGGVREIKEIDSKSLVDITKMFSRGLLMGARGNSGVILSQFFRGIHLGIEEIKNSYATVLEFYNALKRGYEVAYKAVVDPKEGTILTVVREAYEDIKTKVNKDTDLETLLKLYLEAAKKSLENTPNLLPVLKEANVVDSGGTGLVKIIEGMLLFLEGKTLKLKEDLDEKKSTEKIGAKALEDFDIKFGYCTEFILMLKSPKEFDESFLKEPFNNLGDSMVVVTDDDLVKVHIHTNNPGVILNIAQKYGEFKTLKIENMRLQHSNLICEDNCNKNVVPLKKYGFISVCNGDGIKDTFKDLGVDIVIDGGQTMNPSTNDFVEAINKINAENIIILPNNSNIYLAAEQSTKLIKNKNVKVLKNNSIASGYSSLMVFNADENLEENLKLMSEKVQNTQVGEITYAIRDSKVNMVNIKEGDFISIAKGKIISASKTRKEALKKLLENIILDDNEIITVFYGSDVTDDELEELKSIIEGIHEEIELELINGNQDIYSYIIAVE